MQEGTSDSFEKAFSDFLDSQQGDMIFHQFQNMLRKVYLIGCQNGQRENMLIA